MAGAPAGYLGAIMVPLGFFLFFKGQDFGLFKLAMWIQPVIAILPRPGHRPLVFSGRRGPRRGAGPRWALGFFFAWTDVSQFFYYSYASLGTYGGGLTEVVEASRARREVHPADRPEISGGIESDISNVVTAKMLALHTQGIDTRFLSRSYMDNVANIAVLEVPAHAQSPTWDLQARLGGKALPPALPSCRTRS